MLPSALFDPTRPDTTNMKMTARSHLLRGRFRDALDAYADAARFAVEDRASGKLGQAACSPLIRA
ncbi:hypothetical protein HK405_001471, partial [Cladochytrium tenue]